MPITPIFSQELFYALNNRMFEATEVARNLPSSRFNETDDQLLASLLSYKIEDYPTLGDPELVEPPEIRTVTRESDRGSGYIRIQIIRHKCVVPILGDPGWLLFHPLRWTSVDADMTIENYELVIYREQAVHPGATEDQIHAGASEAHRFFAAQIEHANTNMAVARQEVESFNSALERALAPVLSERRAFHAGVESIKAPDGFLVRRRSDAGRHSIPIHRKKVLVARPGPRATRHDPVLDDTLYEDAIDVILNMRNAFERAPTTTMHLNENMFRDILLIGLNAQFEGRAAGEVFNGRGKTDILIRVEDRNVFIAELKIWDGVKRTVIDTLNDQILGRYITWSDSKAALITFIFTNRPTEQIRQAVNAINSHPNCVKAGVSKGQFRWDFLLHAEGDPGHLVKLAFLPFAFPGLQHVPLPEAG